MSLIRLFRVSSLFGALWLLSPLAQADALADLISQAQADVQQGKAQQAYESLAAEEPNYAGNADYDYWFGLTAVRAGQPARASFALERAVLEKPNHAGARLELATAYVQLGQRDAAADELEKLETLNPPPEAQQRIDAINKELNRQASNERQRRNGGYVGAEVGNDDNVGTWPEGLEFFPGATLSAVDSTFVSLKGGYWHRFDLAPDQKLTLSGNAMFRRNQEDEAEQFDQDYLGGRAEWVKDVDGRNEWAVSADLSGLNLDGESYYTMYGVGTEYRQQVSDSAKFITGLQVRQVAFDLDVYDYMATRLLGRITNKPSARWDLSFDFTVDYEAADNGRAGGDSVIYGISGLAWYQLAAKHRFGSSLGYSKVGYRSDYEVGQAINGDSGSRDDDRVTVSLLYDWFPGQRWQVRGQALYRDQQSSLDAFTYDQAVISAGLNYYF
ncbi:MAG: tetratricopeptide repeat protein [Alcanivoracaceae bacterium]|nr:tetratricopeptide repeat protein [Alcanivoracaceae bacterium]